MGTVTEVVLDKVVVHPLVLLSVVDHFSRMGKIGNQKRVVGLLLGSWSSKGILDIANSFAIPFDEDDKDRDGSSTDKTFEHVPTEIGAEEAEEVGVEHLLRDVKDTTVGTLSQRITGQLMGLKGLNQKLQDMKAYLEKVVAGELPMNHEITYQLQDIFNLLPDVTNPVFVRSLQVNTNDQMLVMYIASVIRSVIALHNLINNKLANKEAEKKEGKKEEVKELKEKKEVPEIKAK